MIRDERLLLRTTIVLAALADAVLSSFQLGRRSLWFDEAASIDYAGLGPRELLSAIRVNDAFFGLYYAVMHVWLHWSQSEVALRSFSVACSVAAVIGIVLLARRLGGMRAAMAAAILATINPFGLTMAREGRPYSLLILASTLMSLLFLRAVERPNLARWSLYAAAAIVGCYVHVMALLVVLAHAAWLTMCRQDRWRNGFGLAFAAVLVSLAPLLAVLRSYGVVNAYLGHPGLGDIVTTFSVFAGSLKLVVIGLLCIVAAVVLRRRDGAVERGTVLFVAAWLVVPFVIVFAASQVKPMFLVRYLAEAWPAPVLAVALAIARLPVPAAALALLVFVLLSIPSVGAAYASVDEDWRDAAKLVLTEARPSDGLAVFPQNTEIVYAYYRRSLGTAGPVRIYPAGDPFPLAQEHFPRNESLPPGVRTPRLWVVLVQWGSDPETTPDARHFLASIPQRYHLASRSRFTRVTVLRYDDPRPP